MTAREYEQIILSLSIDSKKFSETEAIIYLLRLAIKKEPIPSVRQLASAFGWGHDKVHRFLKSDRNRTLNRTLLTLNDNKLQTSVGQQIGQKSDSVPALSDSIRNRALQYLALGWSEQQLAVITPTLKQQAAEFYQSLTPFAGQYSQQMLRDFFLYWTAPNPSLTRMAFQMQRTWAVGSRLATWAKREDEIKQSYDQQQRIDKNRQNAISAIRQLSADSDTTADF